MVKGVLVKKFKGSLRIRLNVRLCELLCLSVLLGLPMMLSNYSDFRLVRGYKFKIKIMSVKTAISKLDEAYTSILNLVEDQNDTETINLIIPILNKIDELQNEIEDVRTT